MFWRIEVPQTTFMDSRGAESAEMRIWNTNKRLSTLMKKRVRIRWDCPFVSVHATTNPAKLGACELRTNSRIDGILLDL